MQYLIMFQTRVDWEIPVAGVTNDNAPNLYKVENLTENDIFKTCNV